MKETIYLIFGSLLMAVVYIIACALFPYAACGLCGGDGKKRSSSGKAWRRCRRCKGTGERVRVGRRIWDWVFHR